MTLDDTLWEVLDKVHLGEFFDKHGIPPIVFPIAIIAVIALIVFLVLSMGDSAPPYECGDGICHTLEEEGQEDACPEDCTPPPPPPPSSTDITVYIDGTNSCSGGLRIKLQDQSGRTAGSPQDTTKKQVTFTGITDKSVRAEVSSSASSKSPINSEYINTESRQSIRVHVPEDYCEDLPELGSLKVKVLDSSNNEQITATVTLFDSGDTQIKQKTIPGEGTFTNLDLNEWYYLTAIKDGFEAHNGQDDSIHITGDQITTIRMNPLAVPNAVGELLVCVGGRDEKDCPGSGEISIYTLDDQLYTTGSLSNCQLGQGGTPFERCFSFSTLPAGQQFYAAVTRAPVGCTISEKVGPFLIEEDEQEITTIHLDCDNTGHVRAIVYANNSEVVTDNVTVELYNENGSKIRTMNMSSDGNYTETVSLAAGLEIYFYAKNVPVGYINTRSSDEEVDRNGTLTVEITLRTPPPPLPDLIINGASVSQQILHKNETFTMKAESVKLEDTVLTNGSGVKVTCETSWNQKHDAEYVDEDWICDNMTAPLVEGEKTVVIKAVKDEANDASQSFDVFIVNNTEKSLNITREEGSTRQSPVELNFEINYRDSDGASQAVTQLYGQSLEIIFEESGGLIANTTLSGGATGRYDSSTPVPFKGSYRYKLTAQTVINNELYTGFKQGFFDVLEGSGASIALDVDPELASPDGSINVSVEFKLSGEPLVDQELKLVISGRGESEDYTLNEDYWNEVTERYEREIDLPFTSECIYSINVSSVADSSINDESILYVADPYATGSDLEGCPVNPSDCNTLQDVRNCYQFLWENPSSSSEDIGYTKQCAVRGLDYCTGQSASDTTCYQGLALKVRSKKDSNIADTSYKFYRLSGDSDGQESTLSYTPATLSGDETPDSYWMVYIHMPGGVPQPGYDATGPTASFSNFALVLNMNTTTDELKANTYCPLNCGGLGDLDGDGSASPDDSDLTTMATITDTLQLIGVPPYDEEDMTCVDINEDTYITADDYDCLNGLITGTYSSRTQCPDCTNPTDLEVCHDGVDNNCDGQKDKESYDNDEEELYSLSDGVLKNLCSCNDETPCDMLYDVNGIEGIVSEVDAKRCVSLNGGSYGWKTQTQWQCTTAGSTLECNGNQQYSCDGTTWIKLGGGGTYPTNPL